MATVDIAAVKNSITSLQTRWAAAQAEYQTQKTALAAQVDAYVADHQTAVVSHQTEIDAANAIKATIVPVVAVAESAIDNFILTTPWYKKVVAWVEKQKRWLLWGVGVIALYGIYRFF